MKILIGLLLACFISLISIPVNASSFGLSPAIVGTTLGGGASKTFQFTVSSYSGLVEISSEGMPVTVTPLSITVVDGVPITITVRCNDGAGTGTYDGRIKFLAKSGSSVLAGINVICNLVVSGGNSINLTTNVTDNSSTIGLTTTVISSGGGTYYGGGTPYVEPVRPPFLTEATQSSGSSYIPPQQTYIPIPPVIVGTPAPVNTNTPLVNPSSDLFKIGEFGTVIFWAIMVGLTIAVIYYVWRKRQERY
jgi:hypothetical protein